MPLEVHQSVMTVGHITAGQEPNVPFRALVTTAVAGWFEPSIAHQADKALGLRRRRSGAFWFWSACPQSVVEPDARDIVSGYWALNGET
ncbi:MAG: hypothetical protein H0U16_05910 [Actinobacteria bacterium]|nr:hypothetical protein [Actinomycetota bacterium]